MLSTGSLTAFSAANLVTPNTGTASASTGVTDVRDVRLAPSSLLNTLRSGQNTQTSGPTTTLAPQTNPGQVLPRGSLLNLSV